MKTEDVFKIRSLISEEDVRVEAELKYPIKMVMCSPSESNHYMGGTCDINYYEREAYIKGAMNMLYIILYQ